MSIKQSVRSLDGPDVAESETAELLSAVTRAGAGATCWSDRLFSNIGFRGRLLGLALRRLDDIPAAVVMALEAPEYDTSWLSERAPLITEPAQEEGYQARGLAGRIFRRR
jgi:hypothetical protein